MINDATLYEQAADELFAGVRISRVDDYVLDPEYFWNSEWHVNGNGRILRTDKLAEDILNYFESLKQEEETTPEPDATFDPESTVDPYGTPEPEYTIDPGESPSPDVTAEATQGTASVEQSTADGNGGDQ